MARYKNTSGVDQVIYDKNRELITIHPNQEVEGDEYAQYAGDGGVLSEVGASKSNPPANRVGSLGSQALDPTTGTTIGDSPNTDPNTVRDPNDPNDPNKPQETITTANPAASAANRQALADRAATDKAATDKAHPVTQVGGKK